MKPAAVNAADQLDEIAHHARMLVELLHAAINDDEADLVAAGAMVAGQIGYVADRALGLLGKAQVLGGADQWLLSPSARGESAE